jgi:hypothetical protein
LTKLVKEIEMNKRWFLISLLGLVLLVAIVACSQSTPVPEVESLTDEEVEELIVDRCSECHPASRVFNADYDAEGWSDNIDRMISKGANVSPEEKEVMIDWLVNR